MRAWLPSGLCARLAWALLLCLGSGFAQAAGTPAGVVVGNTATASYVIGGTPGSLISNTGSFQVDARVDLRVAASDVARVIALPSQSAVLSFVVSNEGNQPQDVALSAVNNPVDPFGGVDNFNPDSVLLRVESGATPGYQLGEDLADFIDELAADESRVVYLLAAVPAAQAAADIAAVSLVAQAAAAGVPGSLGSVLSSDDRAEAVDLNRVQQVFADAAGVVDAARDARHSASSAVEVSSLDVRIIKSASIRDGAGGSRAVSGALITYQLQVQVLGTGLVSELLISDLIPANTHYQTNSIRVDGVSHSDAADADASDFNLSVPGAIAVHLGDVAAGKSFSISFDVSID